MSAYSPTSFGVTYRAASAAETRVSFEVERDDWKLEGHVLHGLVHRGDVVERVQGVGAEPDVGGGEDVDDDVVGEPGP